MSRCRGGNVAWNVAIQRPELVEKLIIMNIPHPGAFKVNAGWAQFLRSWVCLAIVSHHMLMIIGCSTSSSSNCRSCLSWSSSATMRR